MPSRSWFRVSGALAISLVATACVADLKVEDDITPMSGAVQPEGNEQEMAAAEACEALKSAETTARTRMGCDERDIQCPGHLSLAGATPCTSYDEGTVTACVAFIEGYKNCSEFESRPCVIAPIEGSCTKPVPPEAGLSDASPDGGAEAGDGGGVAEGGPAEAGAGDASGDGRAPDAGDAGSPPSDGGPDAADAAIVDAGADPRG